MPEVCECGWRMLPWANNPFTGIFLRCENCGKEQTGYKNFRTDWVKPEGICRCAHLEGGHIPYCKRCTCQKFSEEKKCKVDEFLEEKIKNAPKFEGYTIQELAGKEGGDDCPCCGKSMHPIDVIVPRGKKLYKLKKPKEEKR
jgi:hypothetical protein